MVYDRAFADPHPEADGKDFLENLNPASLSLVTAYLKPSLASVAAGQRFQCKRHGYVVTDLKGHAARKTVFNRMTGMKDSWSKWRGAVAITSQLKCRYASHREKEFKWQSF